ncbi:MAG: CsgG/HfaB family protein [Victivallales bacterium]
MKKLMMMMALVIGLSAVAQNEEPKKQEAVNAEVYTVAVLPLTESGAGVAGQGEQVADILFAKLCTNPNVWMVERKDLEKILKEAELSISGAVNPNQAIQIGQLTGAKILITGSVFKVKDKTFLVAKVISTETSRVLGKSVDGLDALDALTGKLSEQVNDTISKDAKKLMPEVREHKDLIADLKKKIGDGKKPKVYVKIEERHVGSVTIDPAAETEMQLICKELGFEVTASENDAELLIKGEGFSEFAGRRGNLISIKSRLEVKVLDKAGNVVAVDKQTTAEVDLAEQIAGKKSLQEASAKIAERILPKIVKK